MKLFWTTLAVFVLAYTATSQAQLVWEQKHLSFKAKVDEPTLAGVYRFTNRGDYPVTIGEIKSSCGCTTTELSKRDYAPGETGEIKAVFTVGNLSGLQRKEITVHTDDPRAGKVNLKLEVDIPGLLQITPRFVFWKTGKSSRERKVMIDVTHDQPIHITEVTSTSSRITAELKTIEAGKKYEVWVKPENVDSLGKATISIKTDYPEDVPKTYKVYAAIK
ncbi:MAG: DUF1573 domain-containing protein [Verrucomicrobiota bacterium]